jgi:VWA domain containing CoxE-like protein
MMVQGHRSWTLVVVNLCFCLLASALVCPCSAAASDCSAPTVLLNAFDRNFNIERDLRAEDIKAEVDGKQAAILSLSFDTHPRRIVLMVDSSGSVEASPQQSKWGIALPAAAYAAYVVPASASSELTTFSDKLRRESSDFENRKVVQTRIFDLAKRQPKGRTSLFDSVHQVLTEFKELHFGDAIYIVTDGGDNNSRISRAKVTEELISRGIRAFVFLVQQRPPQTEEERSGALDMYGFAESTGGAVVRITSADVAGSEQLDNLAPQIVAQVEGVYRLQLGISGVKRTSRVKVALIDRDRKHSTRNTVYSQQIVSCPRGP